MSNIELGNFPPGAVSAVYFFVLEFFALGAIDLILIHVVSRQWHRDIKRGIALEVKSAEIPGVATSLVGRTLAPPNLFAYFVKFVALGVILLADLNINSEVRDGDPLTLTGTFDFDTSVWGNGEERAATRPVTDIRFCRMVDSVAEDITYYRIRFNFTNNEVFENENSQNI